METSRAARHTERGVSASRKSSRPGSARETTSGISGMSANESVMSDNVSVMSENYMADTEDSRTHSPFWYF